MTNLIALRDHTKSRCISGRTSFPWSIMSRSFPIGFVTLLTLDVGILVLAYRRLIVRFSDRLCADCTALWRDRDNSAGISILLSRLRTNIPPVASAPNCAIIRVITSGYPNRTAPKQVEVSALALFLRAI